MNVDGDDSHLVKSEKEFIGAFQLPTGERPVIIGASQGVNPELKFPVDFQLKAEFAGVHCRLVASEAELAEAHERYRKNRGAFSR